MEEKNRITQGISFEPEILELAKKTATARRQSLSAYINTLIAEDAKAESEVAQ